MKRAENLALAALIGLLVIASLLLGGAIMYKSVSLWAGMIATAGQAVVVGLAWWGLVLARQQDELQDDAILGGTSPGSRNVAESNFRMTYGNETQATPGSAKQEVRSLETGFQRTVVGLTAAMLLILSGVIGYLVWLNFDWAKSHLDKPFPIAGGEHGFDELALVIGLGAAVLYIVMWSVTRVRRETNGYGEAVSGNFIVGMPGMIALGAAIVMGYLKITYAQETASIVIAAMLALQGLELGVNAVRSYSSVEEIDQEPVDLQALPLVPMLSSVWISGLKMLFAQSLGLSRDRHSSVVSRLMPRSLLALVVIAILMSCIRVVRPGDVAVLERLGQVQGFPTEGEPDVKMMNAALLQPGLHFTLPWPIDTLVTIPVSRLQSAEVGTELHGTTGGAGGMMDFQFWRFRMNNVEEKEEENEFVTGDPGSPQMLETFVGIWWRVKEPAKFYKDLSHSDFIDKDSGEAKALPIYEALVQQSAAYAVSKTFAIHTLDDILTKDRIEVTQHCRQLLQQKLDSVGSGIEIVDLTIKDVHPPLGTDEVPDFREPDGVRRGPANAYENVVNKREMKERDINLAEAQKIRDVNVAKGEGYTEVGDAKKYKIEQIAKAEGENERLINMLKGFETKDVAEREFLTGLARQQKLFEALRDVMPRVNKVIVGPEVLPPQIWQVPNNGPMMPGRSP